MPPVFNIARCSFWASGFSVPLKKGHIYVMLNNAINTISRYHFSLISCILSSDYLYIHTWPCTALICTDNEIWTSRFSGIAATKMLQKSLEIAQVLILASLSRDYAVSSCRICPQDLWHGESNQPVQLDAAAPVSMHTKFICGAAERKIFCPRCDMLSCHNATMLYPCFPIKCCE